MSEHLPSEYLATPHIPQSETVTRQVKLSNPESGIPQQLRNRLSTIVAAGAVVATLLTAPVFEEVTAHADSGTGAAIGMPFNGKWAYSDIVDPPYSDANSSHPSVHHTPGGGDWGTDLYGNAGQEVRFNVSSPEALSFTWGTATTSCGQARRINVRVNNSQIGTLYVAHLNESASTTTPPTNGMVIGKIANLACNPGGSGKHIHMEFKNTNNHSCYFDHGHPGTALAEGSNLGVLGSANRGAREACAATPNEPNQLTDGTFLKINESGAIYRMVGGAPIRIYNQGALPDFSGQVTNISHERLGQLPTYPSDEGDVISLVEAGGAKYRFVGGAPVRIYNCGAIPDNCAGAINVNFQSLVEHDHMLERPKDGAAISIAEAGGTGIYRFVGGAPIRLFNQGAIPDMPNVVTVNEQSLAAHDHMNERPTNGSAISVVEAGGAGIYRFVGGAPLRLFNWGGIPGFGNVVNVNERSLAEHDHMNTLPGNGEFIASAETGLVYRVAGGAPLRLYNQGGIPGYNGAIFVNQQTIDTRDHQLAVPADGTVLKGVTSETYWQITNGKRQPSAPQSNAITVDEQTIGGLE